MSDVPMQTWRVEPVHCSTCGDRLDAASGEPGKGPEPGDASLCLNCGDLIVFETATLARPPTDDERADIEADPRVQRAASLIKMRGRIR